MYRDKLQSTYKKNILIREKDPESEDALTLVSELSDILDSITGSSGRNSFNSDDARDSRAIFIVAYSEDVAVGCGCIRPIDNNIAEIKRMYVKDKGKGIGTELLRYLEDKARNFGYSSVRLETRRINNYAVLFYSSKGYKVIGNYGKYVNRDEAICFEKLL